MIDKSYKKWLKEKKYLKDPLLKEEDKKYYEEKRGQIFSKKLKEPKF